MLPERYRYPPGPAVASASHAHEEYQLNLSIGEPGGAHCRGACHVVPAGPLSVLMPGEAHTPRDPAGRTVTDTGHGAGFFDAGRFTRHFRRHVGVPPGRFRATC